MHTLQPFQGALFLGRSHRKAAPTCALVCVLFQVCLRLLRHGRRQASMGPECRWDIYHLHSGQTANADCACVFKLSMHLLHGVCSAGMQPLHEQAGRALCLRRLGCRLLGGL